MFNTTITKIKRALKSFGVKGTLTAYQMGDIVVVKINGVDFGIWCTNKNTFVA